MRKITVLIFLVFSYQFSFAGMDGKYIYENTLNLGDMSTDSVLIKPNNSTLGIRFNRGTGKIETTENGTDWNAIGASVMTTSGDMVYHDGTGEKRLPKGADGTFLSMVGGVPGFVTAPVSTTVSAKGELQSHDGTNNVSVPAPTEDGQFLVSDSTEPSKHKWTNSLQGKLNPVTDFVDNGNLEIVATTTNPTKGSTNYDKIHSRRDGDSLDLNINFSQSSAGSAGSGTYYIKLPNGLVGDITKIHPYGAYVAAIVGGGVISTSGGVELNAQFSLDATDPSRLIVQIQGNSGSNIQYAYHAWSSSSLGLNNTQVHLSGTARIPIQGWSSGLDAVVKNKFATIVKGAGNNGGAITADLTNINWTETIDNSNSWNGTEFTAPENGYYFASGAVSSTTTLSALKSYINGAYKELIAFEGNASDLVQFSSITYLNQGEKLSFRSDSSFALNNLSDRHIINIRRLLDNSVVAANLEDAVYSPGSGDLKVKFCSGRINGETGSFSLTNEVGGCVASTNGFKVTFNTNYWTKVNCGCTAVGSYSNVRNCQVNSAFTYDNTEVTFQTAKETSNANGDFTFQCHGVGN